MCNEVNWELKPLFLEGIGINVKSANHKLKLMCCVDGGELNIPHYNPNHYPFQQLKILLTFFRDLIKFKYKFNFNLIVP